MHHANLNLELFPAGRLSSIPAELIVTEVNANEYMAVSPGRECILHFRIAYLNNCCIWHTRFVVSEKIALRVSGDKPCTFLWVGWRNTIHYSIDKAPRKKMLADHYNLYHLAKVEWKIHFPAPGDYETFNVLFSESRITDWNHRGIAPDLSRFLERLKQNHTVFLYQSHKRLTNELRTIVSDLIRGPVAVASRQQYFQQQIEQLLFSLNRELTKQRFIPKTSLHPRETDRLYALRERITEHPGTAYRVSELAREAGMNEKKLQGGFKQLFNKTVFGFIHEQRMQLALRLLREQACTVKEAAAMTGYKNASNFSVSFTAHFGYPPSRAAKE